jgi:hypothetical protein
MAMAGLNDTILVRNTEVVARGDHAVMGTKRFVALGLVFGGVAVQISGCC